MSDVAKLIYKEKSDCNNKEMMAGSMIHQSNDMQYNKWI